MPADGYAHGDGFASVELKGTVVEIKGGSILPLAGVTFHPVPDGSFADRTNSGIWIISDENGNFDDELTVGAATTMGGAEPGRVYQTCGIQVVIEKEGFEKQLLLVDYGMPELNVILTRAR
jgi:hypothetical protein